MGSYLLDVLSEKSIYFKTADEQKALRVIMDAVNAQDKIADLIDDIEWEGMDDACQISGKGLLHILKGLLVI